MKLYEQEIFREIYIMAGEIAGTAHSVINNQEDLRNLPPSIVPTFDFLKLITAYQMLYNYSIANKTINQTQLTKEYH
jgi:hypothetical protein